MNESEFENDEYHTWNPCLPYLGAILMNGYTIFQIQTPS